MRKLFENGFLFALGGLIILLLYGVACCLLIKAEIPISHHVPYWWILATLVSSIALIFSGIGSLVMDFIEWYMKGINES